MTSLLTPVSTTASESDWVAATDVTPEHTGLRTGADKALATLSGATVIVTRAKAFLAKRKELDDVTARQLDKLLLGAAENPGTIPDVVNKRVEAEARQSSILDGYTFCLQPKPGAAPGAGACARTGTANQIDDVLRKSRDLAERQRVWIASKEIGRPLKPGLIELRDLRNQVAKEMGYSSYFALQVADYGMTVPEMMALLDEHARDHAAAVRSAALLGQEHAGRAIQEAGAEDHPGALDRQPLGAGVAGPDRRGEPGSAVQGRVARERS